MSSSNNRKKPFFTGLNRVMVSLGPLTERKHCPFDCSFCYVNNGFQSYMSSSPSEVVKFIKSTTQPFDIVYISGDTDSFGPPRTSDGIRLLEELSNLGIDLLFTTRAIFTSKQLDQISAVSKNLKKSSNLLFSCISIPRLFSGKHLESSNTPSPLQRIDILKKLKSIDSITMLTLRPFLPIIPIKEYIDIISMCQNFTDVVLGESWYADVEGKMEERVFQGKTPKDVEFKLKQMDFDTNRKWWRVWEGKEVKAAIKKHCKILKLPFFMRSQLAVKHVRKSVS